MNNEREKAYRAIDSERDYQNQKWGTVDDHPHDVGGYLKLDDAVADLVGLSSHTDTPFQPDRVRAYLERMVNLIRSDPETLAAVGDNPLHSVVYRAYRFEPCYAHLSDYCAGRIPEVITIDSCNEYLGGWEAANGAG